MIRALAARLERLCRHPRLVPGVCLAAALLCLPALWVGYQADDWLQQAILGGQNPVQGLDQPLMHLFTFMDGDRAHNRHLVELGAIPWWAPPDLRIQFWRPLSALSHMLDHRIAPGVPAVAHAHSIAWFVVLIGLAARLYRRIHGAGVGLAVAGLATLIYALDEAHGMPVGWIAHRNALIAGALGIAALLAHDRYRRDGWRHGAWLMPALLGLALLAGEAAIATLGWLVAYAVCIERGPWRRRAMPLAVAVAVVAAWRAVYSTLGYGTAGSGVYIDPLGAPLAFLRVLPERMVALLADQLVGLPSMPAAFAGVDLRWVMFVVGSLGLAVVAPWLVRALRRSAAARFWGLGLLLSAVPVCATFPAARLLTFVGIGGAGLIAVVIEQTLWRAPERRWRTVAALAGLHLVLAPALLPLHAWSMRGIAGALINPCELSVPRDPTIRERTVVFVNSNSLCAGDQVYQRIVQGVPAPRAIRLLAHGLYDIEVRGVDGHTIELGIPQGMQSAPIDRLMRSDVPWGRVGDVVELSDMRVRIESVDTRGRVDRIRVRFAVPLRDPSLVWRMSRDMAASPFEPPAPGECVRLPDAFTRAPAASASVCRGRAGGG